MTETVQDLHGSLPGRPRRLEIAHPLVRVTQRGVYERFAEQVPRFPEQLDRGHIAFDGAGMLAEPVVNVAEAVPGLAGVELVSDRRLQLQCLPAESDGDLVVLE